MGYSEKREGVTSLLTLFYAILLIAIPYAFFAANLLIGRDSGVFLYSGMVISEGGMPYLDAWDHKGPLLYLFNALGFEVFGGPSGVIVVEAILLALSLSVSMVLWRDLITPVESAIAATLYVATYYLTFQGGNLTETWLLPFLLVTYSLSAKFLTSNDKSLVIPLCVFIGLAASVALLTRLNNGLGVFVLALYVVFVGQDKIIKKTLLIAFSFLLSTLPVIAWLYHNNAFEAFIEQYFLYNFTYVNDIGMLQRVKSSLSMTKVLILSPLGLGLIVIYCLSMRIPQSNPDKYKKQVLGLFAFIFLLELAAQLVSGRGYLHYTTATVASLTLCFVLASSLVRNRKPKFNFKEHRVRYAIVVLVVFLLLLEIMVRPIRGSFKRGVKVIDTIPHELTAYLENHTSPEDQVVVHGGETWLLVSANRRSATSITYYYPVINGFSRTYQTYIDDVTTSRPTYFIEAKGSCGISGPDCGNTKLFSELRSFLREFYTIDKTIDGYTFWRVKS